VLFTASDVSRLIEALAPTPKAPQRAAEAPQVATKPAPEPPAAEKRREPRRRALLATKKRGR
jgi:hypothetical protein